MHWLYPLIWGVKVVYISLTFQNQCNIRYIHWLYPLIWGVKVVHITYTYLSYHVYGCWDYTFNSQAHGTYASDISPNFSQWWFKTIQAMLIAMLQLHAIVQHRPYMYVKHLYLQVNILKLTNNLNFHCHSALHLQENITCTDICSYIIVEWHNHPCTPNEMNMP